jgi:hypothetical protein
MDVTELAGNFIRIFERKNFFWTFSTSKGVGLRVCFSLEETAQPGFMLTC